MSILQIQVENYIYSDLTVYNAFIMAVDQQQINSQRATHAFKTQFNNLSKLIRISENRLAFAELLYGEEIISLETYGKAADSSGKSDQEKASSLMLALAHAIEGRSELLLNLIDALWSEESFKEIAKKLSDELRKA